MYSLIYWFTICVFPLEFKHYENVNHICLLTITFIAEVTPEPRTVSDTY